MKSVIVLSKAYCFLFLDSLNFIRKWLYPFIILIIIIRCFYIGLEIQVIISAVQAIVFFLIVVEVFLLLFKRVLQFKNPPYKLIFDFEKSSLKFILCIQNKEEVINFCEIKEILQKGSNLIFYLKNERKYVWYDYYGSKDDLNENIRKIGVILKRM